MLRHLLLLVIVVSFCPGVLGQTHKLLGTARDGDLARLESMVESQKLTVTGRLGQTVLHEAVMSGSLAVVELLLQKSVELNQADDFGWTALMVAASEGHLPIAKALIKAGADVNHLDQQGLNALYWAAAGDDGAMVKLLIDKGADAKLVDPSGRTILDLIEHTASFDVVTHLRKAGAQKLEDRTGRYPVELPGVEVAPMGQGGQTVSGRFYRDPVMSTVWSGDQTEFDALLAEKAKTDAKGPFQETALHLAVEKRDLKMVQALLKAGAPVDARDRAGWTPLLLAASMGELKIFRALHAGGADLNLAQDQGTTALMMASGGGHVNMVKYLMGKGAKGNLKDNQGRTAVDYVDRVRQMKVFDLLTMLEVKPGGRVTQRADRNMHEKREQRLMEAMNAAPSSGSYSGFSVAQERSAQLLVQAVEMIRFRKVEEALVAIDAALEIEGAECEPCLNLRAMALNEIAQTEAADKTLTAYAKIAGDKDALAQQYLALGRILFSRFSESSNSLQLERIFTLTWRYSSKRIKEAMYYLARIQNRKGFHDESIGSMRIFLASLEANEDRRDGQSLLDGWRQRSAILDGQPLAELPLDGLNGGQLDLQAYRGKVVLLFLHNSRTDAPLRFLKRLSKLGKRKPFEIVGVTGESSKTAAGEFNIRNNLEWPVFLDPGLRTTGPLLGIESYPGFVVLDAEGKVYFSLEGWSDRDTRNPKISGGGNFKESIRVKVNEALDRM